MYIRSQKRIITIVSFILIVVLITIQSSVFSQEEKKVEAPALGSNVNLQAAGLDLAKMTLVEHTFNCLTDCHSVVEFTPLKDFTYDFDTVSGYYVNGSESNGVKSLTYTLQKEITKVKQVDTFGESCSIVNANGTDSEVCNIVKIGYENQTYTDYETLPFSGLKSFKAGESYRILVDLKRQPKLGFNAVDWRLSFNGFELPWSWFFENMSFKRQINTTHSSSGVLNNFTFLVNGTNGFNLGGNTSQIVWANSNINETNYLYYNNNSNYDFTNGSENISLCFDVEYGNISREDACAYNIDNTVTYHFKEMTGTNVKDQTGSNNNGTIFGTQRWNPNGRFGSAYSFNGNTNDGINIPKGNSPSAFTVEMWFKTTDTSSPAWSPRLFGQKGAADYYLGLNSNPSYSNIQFNCWAGGGGTYSISLNGNFNNGSWYYVAIGCDGTTAKLWLNGKGTSISNTCCVMPTETIQCLGGGGTTSTTTCVGSGNDSPWNGTIDEVRVYNYLASNELINRSYEQGLSIMGNEIINNAAPNMPNISYDVSTAYNFTNLNCSTATGISDPNGDSMTVLFNLSVDNVEKAEHILTNQANGSQPSWVIAAANYSKGQNVTCNITLYDGSLYSASNSTSIVISNSAPVLENYNSSSLNRTEVNYTNQQNVAFSENETVMFNINVSDNDTSDSHWYSWFVDNSLEQSSESSWLDWILDLFSSGLHTVRVVVNDSSNANVTHQWNVNVVNVINKFWTLSFVSPPTPENNSNLSSASVNISVQVNPSLLEESTPISVYHNGSADFTGTFSSTELNNTDKSVQLSYANLTGNYTSNVYDAGKNTTWSSLSWGEYLPSNGELEPEAGLVGLWHMNEEFDGILDYSGYDNDGLVLGGVSYSVPGKHYTALSFDGVGGYINVSDADLLDFTTAMTMEAWVKTTGSAQDMGVIFKDANTHNNGDYTLALNSAGNVKVILNNALRATGNVSVSDNQWHHIAATYNKSETTAALRTRIYVDGKLVGLQTGAFGANINTNAQPLIIGRYFSPPYYFNGVMDEVAVWNITLNSSEILRHYNSKITNVSFQARSCDDSLCSGENFVGPSGSSSYYANEAAESLSNLAVNRYFQYKAYLETNSAGFTPKLFNVTVLGNTVAVYSNANTSSVWIDFNGTNVTMSGSNNLYSYINNSLTVGNYNYRVYSNDSYGNLNLTETRTFRLQNYNITFNVTSGEDGSGLNGTTITCNYSGFSQGGDNTNAYGPYVFPVGNWQCNFESAEKYTKTVVFTADDMKIINVVMEKANQLTIQEHDWLKAIYDCLHTGGCDVYNLVNGTNQTVSKIWRQYLPTDKSVLQREEFLSNTSSPSQNITINYTINLPLKEGFNDKELLPLRIFYWFTDTNNKCYNQDKETNTNKAETPFCIPLMAEYLGPNNGSVSFRVDLHPNLPSGTYQIVRSIDIDPPMNGEPVWVNYGREAIGRISVVNDLLVSSTTDSSQETSVSANAPALSGLSGITGSVIDGVKNLGGGLNLNLIIVFAMLCMTVIILGRYKYKK